MAGADDAHPGHGQQGIDEDVHLASTHQALLFGEVVVEVVVNEGRPSRGEREPCLAGRVLLVTPATDGARQGTVFVDEHTCADSLWRRALRAHDGHQGHRTTLGQGRVDGAEE